MFSGTSDNKENHELAWLRSVGAPFAKEGNLLDSAPLLGWDRLRDFLSLSNNSLNKWFNTDFSWLVGCGMANNT